MMKSAVVIGGSMGGLLAARVLANHFDRVTVIERDPIPSATETHRGVPQGHHAHVLLMAGARVVEQLFPGFDAELQAGGAESFDFSADLRWQIDGALLSRHPSDFTCVSSSRPAIEGAVRRRLAEYPNVVIRYGTSVTGVMVDQNCGRVTGVQVRADGEPDLIETIAADLTIDAGGRGTKAPHWLDRWGFARPPQSQVKFGLSYATQIYDRRPDAARDWKYAVISPHRPHETRGAILAPIEGNRWMLTLQTYDTVKPPESQSDLLDYLRSLPRQEIYEEVKDLVPLGPIRAYNYAGQIRHHFARLAKLPEGFIAIGDSICSFDPVFGQGMSVLATEAKILDDMLRERASETTDLQLEGLPRSYFQKVDNVIDGVWLLTSNEAFKYPATIGDCPFGAGPLMQWYTRQLFQLCSTDQVVYDNFVRVMHLIAPPTVLFQPKVLRKVLSRGLVGSLRSRPVAAQSESKRTLASTAISH
jgi:2-polyprenyl-6-methoxyphenol hydroxylase-like FAD-dependent oxidoreductase